MDAEHELLESWKQIPMLQRQVALRGETLKEQAAYLKQQIEELVSRNHNGWEESQRLELLSKLSLLSEIYAIVDFDKMIEVREKFRDMFPEHFNRYLVNLDSLSWHILWPGCLECRHFNGKCSLGLTPMELPDGRKSENRCRSKEYRLKAA